MFSRLKKRGNLNSRAKLARLSGHAAESMSDSALEGGFEQFFTKPFNLDDLLRCIGAAIEKDKEIFQSMTQSLTINQRYDSLTPREKEVCALLVEGLMNKDVAVRLGTTDATIKVHKSRVMEKMRAPSLQELVRLFSLVKNKA